VSDLCVQTHRVDPDRPRPALDGLRLCHGHHRELERLIAELPARYDDLDRAITGAGSGGGTTTHPGLNIDEAAADLRSQIRYDLLTWTTYVTRERGLLGPRSEEPNTTAPWLTIHIDWLAADHYAAVHLLPVLRELTGRTYGIADIPARHLDLEEQCLVHVDGERCDGIITLVVRGDDWTAHCPTCRAAAKEAGEPYVPQDATPYLRLARRGQWITAEDVITLAELFGIAASDDVVRQWKHRRRIRGRLGPDGVVYDLRSVQRYLVQRQTEQRRIAV
ncbi:MAG: hypothetical protein J2P17_25725, partial [Mycobacterium sp.]|nr:hypothetical protein [Mycobacterium sp.]